MKKTEIFVTNKTPLQVAICGHRIAPRAVNQVLNVIGAAQFEQSLKLAYPSGELTMSLKPATSTQSAIQSSEKSDPILTQDRPVVPPKNVEPTTALETLGLDSDVIELLNGAGIGSVEQLTTKTVQELDAIKGIGKATIKKIVAALEENGLSLTEVENGN